MDFTNEVLHRDSPYIVFSDFDGQSNSGLEKYPQADVPRQALSRNWYMQLLTP